MKLSNLILLSIASLAFLYIYIWDISIATTLYVTLLLLSTMYGVLKQEVNVTHISGFILAGTGISYVIFEAGVVDVITPSENKLLQGTIVYGVQFLLNLLTATALIFRVQISRVLSKSKQIELTHFDGIFHWIFLYMCLINLLALLENIAWSYFEMKSWTVIYDNFEVFIYIAYAICCGALLTMMILSAREDGTQASRAS
ncbi:hypothetical protein [Pseudoalteromonas sp. McH1-42]|uniref:hypothetical protein n=1 Tax=Pseudoalteromonas sp. McH1-42 TaxID=2917752 RepID=UPI001EF49FFA|nr:hypothetical protein [Pseudoalteromonas sp. McH1-42]MCG7560323.1 hypothetical protein [Pseudoalteromonas sp. McH1-42]